MAKINTKEREEARRLQREAERRRWLERLAQENTLPWEPDLVWFDKHPDREWRLRPASPREMRTWARMGRPHDVPVPVLDPGCGWMKIIRRHGRDQSSSWATIPLCDVDAVDDNDATIETLWECLEPRRRRRQP